MDKMRRDVKRHSEWWWLCLYDEHGEIGKQAEFDPDKLKGMVWLKFYFHNFLFGHGKKSEQQLKIEKSRLKELRRKQHTDLEKTQELFLQKYHYKDDIDPSMFETYHV